MLLLLPESLIVTITKNEAFCKSKMHCMSAVCVSYEEVLMGMRFKPTNKPERAFKQRILSKHLHIHFIVICEAASLDA